MDASLVVDALDAAPRDATSDAPPNDQSIASDASEGSEADMSIGAETDASLSLDAASTDATTDLGEASPLDAASRDAASLDAELDLGPEASVDAASACELVLAMPMAATDMELFDCGIAAQLGQCYVFDATSCSSCACDHYVRVTDLCTASGSCAAPINGTGCVSSGAYSSAPFSCPAGTDVERTACMFRYLIANGYCG